MNAATVLCKPSNRSCTQRSSRMQKKGDRMEERVYKSLWHVLIAAVGVYELRNHKTKLSKVLATGLIAFHVDAAIADILDEPPLSRRILNYVRPEDDGESESR